MEEGVPQAVMATPDELRQMKKLKNDKRVLVTVLATGLLLVSVAGWYRYDQRLKREQGFQAQEEVRKRIPTETPDQPPEASGSAEVQIDQSNTASGSGELEITP